MAIALSAIPLAITIVSPFGIIQPAYARPIVSSLPDGTTTTLAQFGDVELIGYRVSGERVKTGETIEITTYWRRTRPADPAAQTALHAIVTVPMVASGSVLGRGEVALGNDAYPGWAWALNEIVATRLMLVAKADASAVGDMQLGVRGNSAALIPSEQGEAIGLGRVIVSVPQSCSSMSPLDVAFGGSIKLIGYRLEADALVLCWQSVATMPADYTIFVHVTDNQGQTLAADAPPRGGTYPTSAWLPGEQIEDRHALPIAAAAIKQIAIGWYRPDSGERLTINGGPETEVQLIK